jgi:hypothetical protein
MMIIFKYEAFLTMYNLQSMIYSLVSSTSFKEAFAEPRFFGKGVLSEGFHPI